MKKTATALIFCIFCLALVLTGVALSAPAAVADEIKIYPDDTSSYAAYGKAIAYTTDDHEIVLSVEGASFTLTSAFEGTAKSIAMNGSHIFLISAEQTGNKENVSFTAYGYTLDPVCIKAGANALGLFDNVSDEDIRNNEYLVNEEVRNNMVMGGFDYVYVSGDYVYCMARAESPYPEGSSVSDCLFAGNLATKQCDEAVINMKDFSTSTDFVVADNATVYYNSGNKLYSTAAKKNNPESALVLDTLEIHSIAYANGLVYALSADGIYAIDVEQHKSKALLSETFDGDIRILKDGDVTYLLAQDKAGKCIRQYVCGGSSLESASLTYHNVFDGVIYENPSEFTLLKVGKTGAATDVYFSPKNHKIEYTLEEGDYVLALALQDGYYYVRNAEGKLGYVDEGKLTVFLEASSETDIGKYAQALTDGTAIYKYPYVSNDVVATVDIDDVIIVIDNVATDDGVQVWGWYKVCIVGEDNSLTYGYVQQKGYVSAYTNLKPPSFAQDATVSAGSLGGIINVYLLPDEESEVLGTLTDGDKVSLNQEKLDASSEWTKIVYNDMVGYVKTENLITEGITPLQITLIVVFAVVIVATAIVVILVVKKRNAQKFDY